MRNLGRLVLVCAVILLIAGPAVAHSPVPGAEEGSSPETAYVVSEPLKSWAFYSELHEGGEAHYFRMELGAGDRLVLNLYIPGSEKGKFLPGVVIIGPGVPANDTPPSYIEVEDGLRAMVVNGTLPESAGYEPFTPASYYYLVDKDIKVTEKGTYYVAVHEPNHGGRYGIAIGYEETFTAGEWVLLPFSLLKIREWEGQTWTFPLMPLAVTLVLGLGFLAFLRPASLGPATSWAGIPGGLLLLGSGLATLMQMVIALAAAPAASAWVTLMFAAVPMGLGIAIINVMARRPDRLSGKARLLLLLSAPLGILLMAGYIVGPVLCISAALLPHRPRRL